MSGKGTERALTDPQKSKKHDLSEIEHELHPLQQPFKKENQNNPASETNDTEDNSIQKGRDLFNKLKADLEN